MAGHLSADTAEALGRRRDIAARLRAAQRALEVGRGAPQARRSTVRPPTAFTAVAATLEAGMATQAPRSRFLTRGRASWRPLYDLTLDRRAAGRQLPGRGDPADR